MCGILGQINREENIDKPAFTGMLDLLSHRGPDNSGMYFSADGKIALGHRRLALIDLSERASQPMCNEDRSIWITVNGEIYNYPELRKQLEQKGHTFYSHSDSEVIIHGYEQWGFSVLARLKGMFAFGLWDEKKQILFLARDRFGIKPIYYTHKKNNFIFASELKSIIQSPGFIKDIDYSSFCDFFTYRYIPSPKTIWQNVYKLPPAHYLIWNDDRIQIKEYWELFSDNQMVPRQEAVEQVDSLIQNSIREHVLSDVPVGSFLSGGYDSSALVYYLSRINYPIKTFSLGFENWEESEHRYAEIVAELFKTEHKTKIIGQEELNLLDKLVQYYDEPIADISIIPTFKVSELARSSVKAVLSGEGADEIFGGYDWYKTRKTKILSGEYIHRIKQQLLFPLKKFSVEDYSHAMAMGFFGDIELPQLLHNDLQNEVPANPFWFYEKHYRHDLSPIKRFQYLDIKTFMGELTLTKMDRASMANSLEVRVPYLDHELVEYIFGLSEQVYINKNTQKFLLYENIKNVLPPSVLNRAKQGFVGPDEYYMNMPWYENIMAESKLIKNLIIDERYIEHLFETKDFWRLWKVAVMEKWYSHWV